MGLFSRKEKLSAREIYDRINAFWRAGILEFNINELIKAMSEVISLADSDKNRIVNECNILWYTSIFLAMEDNTKTEYKNGIVHQPLTDLLREGCGTEIQSRLPKQDILTHIKLDYIILKNKGNEGSVLRSNQPEYKIAQKVLSRCLPNIDDKNYEVAIDLFIYFWTNLLVGAYNPWKSIKLVYYKD